MQGVAVARLASPPLGLGRPGAAPGPQRPVTLASVSCQHGPCRR